MTKNQRIFLFVIFALVLALIYWVWGRPSEVNPSIKAAMFSALLMLSFVALFLEHYFTRPADVLSAAIAIMLALAPMHQTLADMGIWYYLFFVYLLVCAVGALFGLLLVNRDKPSDALTNRSAAALTRFSGAFGNGRFLFAAFFLLCLIFYVDSQSALFLVLAFYSAALLLVEPQKIIGWWIAATPTRRGNELGHIIGVQSKNTFLAKLLTEHAPVKRFDFVQFRYSMSSPEKVLRGLIVDNYLLNEEQWVKILCSAEVNSMGAGVAQAASLRENAIYPVEVVNPEAFLDKFVGVVIEGSNVSKIRFEYAHRIPIEEGAILGVKSQGKTILYQLVGGFTDVEQLQFKNESALIVGEAVQLGCWNEEGQTFTRFGWVPEINSPVLKVSPSSEAKLKENEIVLGKLPGTGLPVIFNVRDAVTHHMAVLGVTGSGKSVFTRDLIRKISAQGTKIICVDFTQEYQGRMADLGASALVDPARSKILFDAIDRLVAELVKFPNQQDKPTIDACERLIEQKFTECITAFADSDDKIKIFELPDVANSSGILEYTRWFFRSLFILAKSGRFRDANMCVVLEEAHTVVPEWNFSGADDRRSQSLVNSISQIALQGRKYGVGFLVVAQRTANVSKTILTQCNSIVAFKQFDRTGSDFLANYVGTTMVEVLPTLRERHAIVAGKALGSGTPVIFEVPVIKEP